MTFLAATGDQGSPSGYPAYSPNVVAVGGTSLYLNADNSYEYEKGWSEGSDPWDFPSAAAAAPASTKRSRPTSSRPKAPACATNPDVSFDADPQTGVLVYDSYNYATSPWQEYGGTSLGTPCWAGLIAIANQGRAQAGQATLNSSTDPQQTLTALYSLPSADFNDITVGYNGGFFARPGYDEVTGIGTPVANNLVPDLAAYGVPSQVVIVPPISGLTAGNTFSVTGQVEDSLGDLLTSFNGSMTVSLANNPADATLGGTLTTTVSNGQFAFSGLTIDHAGVGYTLSFQSVTADGTVTIASSPFAVSPAQSATSMEQITAPVSATDGNGDSLNYTVQVGGYNSLFVLEQQYDLQAPSAATNYYCNARGCQEKYLVSDNGNNAAAADTTSLCPMATCMPGSAAPCRPARRRASSHRSATLCTSSRRC